MNNPLIKTFSIILILSGLSLSTTVHARLKCWTNNEGVKECGNSVPPEYAQRGHQELNKSGVVKDEKKRAKTDEELDEQKRLDEIQAEKDKIAAEQKKKDDDDCTAEEEEEEEEKVLDADCCVCTVPLGVLKRNIIQFDPPLSDEYNNAIRSIGFGVLNKIMMLFDTKFWITSSSYA